MLGDVEPTPVEIKPEARRDGLAEHPLTIDGVMATEDRGVGLAQA